MRDAPVQNMDAVILAGGDSSRFLLRDNESGMPKQFNKALLPWGNSSMLGHVVRVYQSVFQRVVVLSNEPLKLEDSTVPIMADRISYKVRSSKAGIINALHAAKSGRVCIGACDMPLVSRELLLLVSAVYPDRDLVIPLVDQYFQPLPAIYSKKCLAVLAKQLAQDNHRLLDFFGNVSLGLVDERLLNEAGISHTVFMNVNTVHDYQMALAVAKLK
jgi:molybdopterin-guanine dinucleotide biosynthesis protein A